MEKELFSFSRLDTFNNCPRSYYYTYILHQRGGDNIYSFLGTAVHEAVEQMDNGKISAEQGLDMFLEAVDDADMLGLPWISDNVARKYIDCVSHYFYNYKKPEVKEIHTEEHFIIDVGKISIQGYIDKWYEKNGAIYIEDYKTSSKFTAKHLIDKQRQLSIYGRALEDKFPEKPIFLGFNMLKYALINGKLVERNTLDTIGDYQDGMVNIPYTPELKQDLEAYVADTIAGIEKLDKNIPYKWDMAFNPEKEFFCCNLCSHQKKCLNQADEWK
ncbi:MAG: PD-(D/E)XK nuclease family protein [Oscillospiraceae bacterium]